MLAGTTFFVVMFAFVNIRTGIDQLINAMVKSIPAQYLSWCITRDQSLRIKANTSRGVQSKIDELDRKDFVSTVSPELVEFQNKISTGLIFCAFGDFCLAMELHPQYGVEAWFLTGLISFLVGHLFFTHGLSTRIKAITRSKRVVSTNNWAAPFMAVYVLSLIYVIVPHVEDPVLQVGVGLYGAIIGTMTYHSIVLTTCEANLHDYCRSEYSLLPAADKSQYPG